MYRISPHHLFTPKGFVQDHSVIFDKEIIAVGPSKEIIAAYPHARHIPTNEHSILMPGLINAHVHLEFSANKTTLKYGRFLPWLYSVMQHRDSLMPACDTTCLHNATQSMLHSGTTTFGAISSYATDMQACIDTPQKVVYFNELIGSNPAAADALFGDFVARLDDAKAHASPNFVPAIAIHSPYAVHPILIQKALQIAKNESLLVTAHFLESPAEKEWLEDDSGEFATFFNDLLGQEKAVTTSEYFLRHFNHLPTLFTHATQLDSKTLSMLQEHQHTVIHCPISNRLLGNGVLDINALYEHNINYLCGTDGLSSNYSLNLFEELKAALFMHNSGDLSTLALSLLHSVTTTAGEALGLNTGKIEQRYAADLLVLDPGVAFDHEDDIALHAILHQFPITHIFIDGVDYADA